MEKRYTLGPNITKQALQDLHETIKDDLDEVSARSTSALTIECELAVDPEQALDTLSTISNFIADRDVDCRVHTTGSDSIALTVDGPSDLLAIPAKAALVALAARAAGDRPVL